MSGDATTGQPKVKPPRTPETHYKWQSADAQGANQALEILDKVRTSNMIFRGQKQLQGLVDLKNRLLFGKDAVESVAIPEDDVKINCPEIHNHYGDDKPAPAVATSAPQQSGLLGSAVKIGLGALLAGTGVGSAIAIPTIASGVMEMMKPTAVIQPAETPKTESPTVTIGGQEYKLELGEPDE